MDKLLVIDDDRTVRVLVERGLSTEHLHVYTAATGHEGLRLLELERPHVALIDVMMPEIGGLELFHKIRAHDSKIPIIFVTSDNSSETTIQCIRLGAYDYLPKPINLEQLRKLTHSALEARRLMDQPVAISVSNNSQGGERFIGCSESMLDVFKSIGRVAGQNVAVLIRGESGCGKELVARAIVQHSPRNNKPFLSVNCAAIPDQLLESELFGHEKGAFTGAEKRRLGKFEEADSGTIFLDEIGDMSPVVQGKVLRLLQEQRFQRLGSNDELVTDVRIITATNRHLEKMVNDGQFREDLLYRLNGYTISIPPLRDRKQDIPLLLEYFVQRAKKEMGRDLLEGVAQSAMDTFCDYDWPGNIRQLQSVVRHSILHETGTILGVESLPAFIRNFQSANKTPTIDEANQDKHALVEVPAIPNDSQRFANRLDSFIEAKICANSKNLYAEAVAELEKHLILRVLDETGGNQSKTAEILGITRGKVRDRIQAFGIQIDRTVSE